MMMPAIRPPTSAISRPPSSSTGGRHASAALQLKKKFLWSVAQSVAKPKVSEAKNWPQFSRFSCFSLTARSANSVVLTIKTALMPPFSWQNCRHRNQMDMIITLYLQIFRAGLEPVQGSVSGWAVISGLGQLGSTESRGKFKLELVLGNISQLKSINW